MEQRLIDANVFKENVVKYSHQSLKTIGLALDETPTVDAAPVVFINDPFHVVYQAFKELYPDKECEILFDYNVETTDTHERVKGVTIFPDDGSIPQIRIDCEQILMRDAADALEAAEKRIDGLQKLVDINTERCEALRKQLREAHESYEKHINELEAQLPKEGEWVEDDTTYCGAYLSNYKCSLCGKIGGTWRRGLKQDELPPFCGSCGARMRTVTDCHTLESER